MVDITSVEQVLLGLLQAALLAVGLWVGKRLAAWLQKRNASLDVSSFDDALQKTLAFGLQQAQSMIKAKGWDHIDVRNSVLQTATTQMINKFPDALAGVGLSTDRIASSEGDLIMQALDRAFPAAVAVAAASPATPPVVPALSSINAANALGKVGAVLLMLGALVSLSACANVDQALSTPAGQLFCAVQVTGGGTIVAGLINAEVAGAAAAAAPLAIVATGATKAYVDAACLKAGGVAVSPPPNPAAAPQIAVVAPTV